MDRLLPHDVACFGEVLWDLLPTGPLPGGAPMNVAYHLKKLGAQPALISKIGLDDWGKKLVQFLADTGVNTDFFDMDYEQATGLVHARISQQGDVTYDIANPSAWDYIECHDDCLVLVQKAPYFVYGSLTSRNRVSRDTLAQLLEVAQTKVLDINLRPPFVQRTHIESLLQSADILKMNLAELELITGWFSRFKSAEDRIRLVQDRFDIATLIVTLGSDGAMASHNGNLLRHPAYAVTVADTIGSGDAFLAGYLSQVLAGASISEALRFASATGAFIATQSGACPAYEISAIKQLMATSTASLLQTTTHS